MLQAIKGYYEDGNIVLEEAPGFYTKTAVIVTFIEEPVEINKQKGGIILGSMKGKLAISDDFDEPLPELEEYMKTGL
jgi:hypothetical protein